MRVDMLFILHTTLDNRYRYIAGKQIMTLVCVVACAQSAGAKNQVILRHPITSTQPKASNHVHKSALQAVQ